MDVPARYEETFEARYADLGSIVPEAFERLGWRVITASPERWRARVSIHWWSWGWRSWGEVFTVAVTPGGTVYAESECVIPTAVLDFGKNRQNVQRFKAVLHEVGNEAPA